MSEIKKLTGEFKKLQVTNIQTFLKRKYIPGWKKGDEVVYDNEKELTAEIELTDEITFDKLKAAGLKPYTNDKGVTTITVQYSQKVKLYEDDLKKPSEVLESITEDGKRTPFSIKAVDGTIKLFTTTHETYKNDFIRCTAIASTSITEKEFAGEAF